MQAEVQVLLHSLSIYRTGQQQAAPALTLTPRLAGLVRALRAASFTVLVRHAPGALGEYEYPYVSLVSGNFEPQHGCASGRHQMM